MGVLFGGFSCMDGIELGGFMYKHQLIKELKAYRTPYEDERHMVNDTIAFLQGTDDFLGKSNKDGHITGSVWIVNKDRSQTLLTHHYKLDKWLQLGGHTEADETVIESAEREGFEESGLKNLKLVSEAIYDVDVHLIPARKNEKAHYHYDIRYLLEGDSSEEIQVSDESHDVKWVLLNEIENYSKSPSILRMVEKLRSMR